ncbi:hypothetical protein HYH03_009146 [Edaphochlamys debaryana]|uniref:Uncharacterized protein n=1 Tax=Edaphochlamys debaryana TaxID=47281 RepID=A0A835XYE5_9CHLO|nr:hypothetical protein HYH03_009146 [Edaphochlamys debaryana]|eukprot:KAG2492481.1 hypothetical protein HYH03_009146 [Edaphochlamys debaryana]
MAGRLEALKTALKKVGEKVGFGGNSGDGYDEELERHNRRTKTALGDAPLGQNKERVFDTIAGRVGEVEVERIKAKAQGDAAYQAFLEDQQRGPTEEQQAAARAAAAAARMRSKSRRSSMTAFTVDLSALACLEAGAAGGAMGRSFTAGPGAGPAANGMWPGLGQAGAGGGGPGGREGASADEGADGGPHGVPRSPGASSNGGPPPGPRPPGLSPLATAGYSRARTSVDLSAGGSRPGTPSTASPSPFGPPTRRAPSGPFGTSDASPASTPGSTGAPARLPSLRPPSQPPSPGPGSATASSRALLLGVGSGPATPSGLSRAFPGPGLGPGGEELATSPPFGATDRAFTPLALRGRPGNGNGHGHGSGAAGSPIAEAGPGSVVGLSHAPSGGLAARRASVGPIPPSYGAPVAGGSSRRGSLLLMGSGGAEAEEGIAVDIVADRGRWLDAGDASYCNTDCADDLADVLSGSQGGSRVPSSSVARASAAPGSRGPSGSAPYVGTGGTASGPGGAGSGGAGPSGGSTTRTLQLMQQPGAGGGGSSRMSSEECLPSIHGGAGTGAGGGVRRAGSGAIAAAAALAASGRGADSLLPRLPTPGLGSAGAGPGTGAGVGSSSIRAAMRAHARGSCTGLGAVESDALSCGGEEEGGGAGGLRGPPVGRRGSSLLAQAAGRRASALCLPSTPMLALTAGGGVAAPGPGSGPAAAVAYTRGSVPGSLGC